MTTVRIDDFPTGVRPIIPDIGELFAILDAFERNCITFHLGIVPMTLQRHVPEMDIDRLNKYRYMVPCQHGYNHRYDEMSGILRESGDLYNTHTVGIFDEFEGNTAYDIVRKVAAGHDYLQKRLNRIVDHYIPVCNVISPGLDAAIRACDIRNVFVVQGRNVPGVENITADYYGTVADYSGQQNPVFHVTWEWDWIRAHGRKEWGEHFKRLL